MNTLKRLFDAITNPAINKTWIASLEPDGGAPWREFTEALGEAQRQLETWPSPDRATENENEDVDLCPGGYWKGSDTCKSCKCPPPSDYVRSALADDERVIRQFFNDGADGNRSRKALDRIMVAIRSLVSGARPIA